MNNKETTYSSGFISLIGRPNAGKSTLLNKLIGQKVAIISDKPQTTRNRIMGVLTDENWQMVFIDTPGVHKPIDKLGEQMVKTAMNTMNEVDVVYLLVDATVPFGGGDQYLLDRLEKLDTPVFLLLNKIDCLPKKELLPLIDFYSKKMNWQAIIPISALNGENLQELIKDTVKYLEPGPRYFPEDVVTDQPERLIIAEIIREKVIRSTREEVPHAVFVDIELIEKRSQDMLYIGAIIYVERNSQKGIIIGRKGEMLKNIGSLARHEIEQLLGNKVFLDLRVKIKADWRNKNFTLREFGYME